MEGTKGGPPTGVRLPEDAPTGIEGGVVVAQRDRAKGWSTPLTDPNGVQFEEVKLPPLEERIGKLLDVHIVWGSERHLRKALIQSLITEFRKE
jgi:hypothetical protein